MTGAGRGAAPLYAAAGALVGLMALALQLWLLLQIETGKGGTALDAVVAFFSFFTILSNVLVIVVYGASLLGRPRFFVRPGVQTAVGLYIIIVGLVYALVLQQLWDPKGLAKLADVALHYVAPVLYVIYWLVFVDKSALAYRHIPAWLVFPVVYAVYAMVRGLATGIYAYPFLEIPNLGVARVGLNVVVLVAAFAVVGALLVAAGRALSRPSRSAAL